MKKRLLVTRRLPDEIHARAARDYDALLNPEDKLYSTEELVALSGEVDGFLVCLTDKLPRAAIDRFDPRLKVISTFSVGYEHVDAVAARERGIPVGNAPNGVTIATAEIAMLLMLGATRRAPEGERMISAKAWTGWTPMQSSAEPPRTGTHSRVIVAWRITFRISSGGSGASARASSATSSE